MNGYYESACMHAHTCIYVHVHAHTHMHVYIHIQSYIHILHIHTSACTSTHTHACTNTHTHIHTCTCNFFDRNNFKKLQIGIAKSTLYWELKELLLKAWSNRFKILHWVPNVGFIIKCFGWTIKSKSKDTI